LCCNKNRPFYKQNFFEKMTKYNNFSIESKGNHPSDLPGQTVLPSVMAIQLSSCTRNNSLAGSSKKSESPPRSPSLLNSKSWKDFFGPCANKPDLALSHLLSSQKTCIYRETRERWPLLTVEI
jgi:hypothetical protein